MWEIRGARRFRPGCANRAAARGFGQPKGDAMFETLIWATDGSATADRALPYLKELAAPAADIFVVHVRELIVGRGGGFPVYADEPELQERIAAQVEELR